jgi:cytochrome P450
MHGGIKMSYDGSSHAHKRGIPEHVPPELVRELNLLNGPGMDACPHAVFVRLHEGPRTIFAATDPYRVPAWVPTKWKDIRDILRNAEVFSSERSAGFSALVGEHWPAIPVEIDPPKLAEYRELLRPHLSASRIVAMEPLIRARAAHLIEAMAAKGKCEFMAEFGRGLPIYVFLQLMDLPVENIDVFYGWVGDVLNGADMGVRSRAARAVVDYLRKLSKEREGGDGDDLVTLITNARINDVPLTDDEIIGMLFLVFGGGIDTVANTLGFIFPYLATHQELQARLRSDRSVITRAAEELLRLHAIPLPYRQAKCDIEAAGVHMKKGDWVQLLLPSANLDPDQFENPMQFDLDRPTSSHVSFSFGPHRCLGMNLARREIAIALEEWFSRLPPFRLAPGDAYRTHGGLVIGVDSLHLEWN